MKRKLLLFIIIPVFFMFITKSANGTFADFVTHDMTSTISTGAFTSFAISSDGNLWAWGHNDVGQLGDGTTDNSYTPIKIMGGVVAVSAGLWHTAAIKNDGSLWTWGFNHDGQLGDGTSLDRHYPIKIMEDVVAVSAGNDHTMAVRADGSLWACAY